MGERALQAYVQPEVSCAWSRLTLSDVSQLGLSLRHIAVSATSVCDRAQGIAHLLYESFRGSGEGEPVCPLVRVFETVPSATLNHADRAYLAQQEAVLGEARGETVLQLIGSYGLHPGWCDPALSSRYRCVSVNETTFVSQYPMLSLLMESVRTSPSGRIIPSPGIGGYVDAVMTPGLQILYVPDARKSPYVPAQSEFVEPYQIRSVIGFGGEFQNGECFFVVMFSREVIPQSVLPLIRILSLNIRLGLERMAVVTAGEARGMGCSTSGIAQKGCLGDGDGARFEVLVGLYEEIVMQQDRELHQEHLRSALQQREILDHMTRIQALNRQLLVAAEEERRVLSRDLHDIVATQLGGLIFQMQAVLDVPGTGRNELLGWIGQYREELLGVVQRTRELSFGLHPSSLERAGVAGALERLLLDAGRRQGWVVEVACEESVERVLTYEESVCVYRVAQEAIHNCEKHAQATRVRLSLGVQGSELVLCVTDNGCGFENSVDGRVDRDSGLGHLGMSERAHLIRAVLKIETTCTVGTTVALFIQDGGRVHREGIAC